MAALPLIIGGIGTLLSTAGALAQGQQAAAMGELQQKAYNQQAQADQKASAFEQMRERHKQELLLAQARAKVGASGVALAGSPSEVLLANVREGELDIQAIQYGSTLRQNQLRTQGNIAKFSGDQAKSASYINAGSNFVSGISQMFDPNKALRFGQSQFV